MKTIYIPISITCPFCNSKMCQSGPQYHGFDLNTLESY